MYKNFFDKKANLTGYRILIFTLVICLLMVAGIVRHYNKHANTPPVEPITVEKEMKVVKKEKTEDKTSVNKQDLENPENIDTFFIKKTNGKVLTMTRYDRKNDEYKEEEYVCDYSNLDNSADMFFNLGEVVIIKYESINRDVYPYEITVEEIYTTQWNQKIE